ncbi:MAG TPA: hypothetical protein ENJ95_11170 [Bacteroidetes bacterium]|nr:hypothetical protein [Bacteroidota bacterium]
MKILPCRFQSDILIRTPERRRFERRTSSRNLIWSEMRRSKRHRSGILMKYRFRAIKEIISIICKKYFSALLIAIYL